MKRSQDVPLGTHFTCFTSTNTDAEGAASGGNAAAREEQRARLEARELAQQGAQRGRGLVSVGRGLVSGGRGLVPLCTAPPMFFFFRLLSFCQIL